jgi:uncharacterized protein YgiM (DUF1202 family)
VTPNFQDPFVAVRAIYYYHAVERRWGDIGYNYLVDYLGNVYEGRFGGQNVVGGHAHRYANGSSGIGVLGDFSLDATTVEAQAGLVWITAWVARYLDPYGVADFHETPSLPTICGHRDVEDSTCPGDVLYGQLDVIRDLVAAVLGGEQPLLAADFAVGDSVTVAIDDANLRSGPGTDFEVLTTLPIGTVLTITDGPAAGGENAWYAVTGAAGDGWCAAYVLSPQERSVPSGGLFAAGEEVVVGTDALNMRDDVSLEASVIAVLPQGTEGTVLEGPLSADGDDWYLLDTAFGAGWAVGSYLVRLSALNWFDVGQSVSVVDGSLNLRDAPGLSATVVDTMSEGTALTIAGTPEPSDGSIWYPVVTASDAEGWCVGEFLVAT